MNSCCFISSVSMLYKIYEQTSEKYISDLIKESIVCINGVRPNKVSYEIDIIIDKFQIKGENFQNYHLKQ